MDDHFDYLYNPGNTENTLIMFNSPDAFFIVIAPLPTLIVFYITACGGKPRDAGKPAAGRLRTAQCPGDAGYPQMMVLS